MTMNSDPASAPLRRSILSLPASNERAIAKLSTLDMDAVILDLEDAVASDMKDVARRNIRAFLEAKPLAGREVIVRVNDKTSPFFAADLALVLECQPAAILLPKVRTHEDILDLSTMLSDSDAPDSLRIWAMMETPLAVLNAGPIAEMGRTAGGRLDALVLGLNDLRKDTGVAPDPARTYLIPWLMQVLLAGRAFGLSMIDSVSNDFRNLNAFEAECRQGKAMGFDGKMLIHPAQIEGANSHFGPSLDQLAEADDIIKAFSAPGAEKLNVLEVGGHMVERLHFQQALALRARADIINARNKPE